MVVDRPDSIKAEETVAMSRTAGMEAWVAAGDIGGAAADNRLVAQATKPISPLDIPVNHADVERRADFWNVTEEDYGLELDVNLLERFFASKRSSIICPRPK